MAQKLTKREQRIGDTYLLPARETEILDIMALFPKDTKVTRKNIEEQLRLNTMENIRGNTTQYWLEKSELEVERLLVRLDREMRVINRLIVALVIVTVALLVVAGFTLSIN